MTVPDVDAIEALREAAGDEDTRDLAAHIAALNPQTVSEVLEAIGDPAADKELGDFLDSVSGVCNTQQLGNSIAALEEAAADHDVTELLSGLTQFPQAEMVREVVRELKAVNPEVVALAETLTSFPALDHFRELLERLAQLAADENARLMVERLAKIAENGAAIDRALSAGKRPG